MVWVGGLVGGFCGLLQKHDTKHYRKKYYTKCSRSAAEELQKHCKALQKYCRSIAEVLQKYCRGTAKYCKALQTVVLQRALQKYCRSTQSTTEVLRKGLQKLLFEG